MRPSRSRRVLTVAALSLAPAVLTALTVVPAAPAQAVTVADVRAALSVSAAASTALSEATGGFRTEAEERFLNVPGGFYITGRLHVRGLLDTPRLRITSRVDGAKRYSDRYWVTGTADGRGGTYERLRQLGEDARTVGGWYGKPDLAYVRRPSTTSAESVRAEAEPYEPGRFLADLLATRDFRSPARTVGATETTWRVTVTNYTPTYRLTFVVRNSDHRLVSLFEKEVDGDRTVLTRFTYDRPGIAVPDDDVWVTLAQWRRGRTALELPRRSDSWARGAAASALDTAAAAHRAVTVDDVRTAAAAVWFDPVERTMVHTTEIPEGVKFVGKNPFTGKLSVRYLRVDDGDVVISKT